MSQFSIFEVRINQLMDHVRTEKFSLCPWCVLRNCYILKAYRNSQNILDDFLRLKTIDFDKEQLTTFLEGDCWACLNILSLQFRDEVAKKVAEEFKSSDFQDVDEFDLVIQLPVCLTFRNQFFHRLASNMSSDFSKHIVLKELFKIYMSEALEKLLNKPYRKGAVFKIDLSVVNEEGDKECQRLMELSPASFFEKRCKNAGTPSALNHSSVLRVIDELEMDDLKKMLSIGSRCEYSNTTFYFDALFLAGRYNKYSRTLSQTPWLINGVNVHESSIEKKIRDGLEQHIKFESFTLSSSGREDVDVRMLGRGRPFLLEILNPNMDAPIETLLRPISNAITAQKDIRIRDLQVVSRLQSQDFLKETDDSKSKVYQALCCLTRALTPFDFDKIKAVKDLPLSQLTPLRVMHRRTLAERIRTVYALEAFPVTKEEVDEEFPEHSHAHERIIKLNITAEAGTYIKEFVHSDFGRTTPNLCTILGDDVRADIIALDVIEVICDFPTRLADDSD